MKNNEYWINYNDDILLTHVHAFVVQNNEKVLICRKNINSKWELPGGGIKKGETYIQTIKRELLEEVQLVPTGNIIPYKVFYQDTKEHLPNYRLLIVVLGVEELPRQKDICTNEIWEIKWEDLKSNEWKDLIKINNIEDFTLFLKKLPIDNKTS